MNWPRYSRSLTRNCSKPLQTKRKSPVSPPGFLMLNHPPAFFPRGRRPDGGRCLLAGLPAWQTDGGKKLPAIAHEPQQEKEQVDEVEIEAQRAHDRLLAHQFAVIAREIHVLDALA